MTAPIPLASPNLTILGWGSTYLDAARRLAVEASSAASEPSHEGQRAAGAIFLAAAALETTAHELAFLLGDTKDLTTQQLCEVREAQPTDQFKKIAIAVCCNRGAAPPSFGVAEFERAVCVWKCRNHLIHYEPERRPLGTWPPDLAPFSTKNWLPTLNTTEHWTSRLPTAPVADRLVCFTREFLLWYHGVFPLPAPLANLYPFR